MNKLFIGCLIFSSLLQSNEISFNQVTEPSQNTIEISFILENVAFIKSYSLESPSRIVLDVFDSKLKSDKENESILLHIIWPIIIVGIFIAIGTLIEQLGRIF